MAQTQSCKVKSTPCSSISKRVTAGYCNKHYIQFRKHGVRITIKDPRPAVIKDEFALIPIGIEASQGYAIVDKEFSYLDKFNWCLKDGGPITTEKPKYMHRFIMPPPQDQFVDHIDGNRLDNRLSNLRLCTKAENNRNKGLTKSNTLGYKGVSYNSKIRKYRARVYKDYVSHSSKYFASAKEAALAYDKLAKKLHGEFARVNFG